MEITAVRQHDISVKFGENELTFTPEEMLKVSLYLYWSSGVKCYDKDGNYLKDPFEKTPESYTIDLTKDYNAILYDLSTDYYFEFPAPNEQEAIELLTKGQKTVKYVFDHIPWTGGEYTNPGSFKLVETAEKEEADNG